MNGNGRIPWLHWEPKINLGHILVAISLLAPLLWTAITYANTVDVNTQLITTEKIERVAADTKLDAKIDTNGKDHQNFVRNRELDLVLRNLDQVLKGQEELRSEIRQTRQQQPQ